MQFKNIIVTTDFSDNSNAAVAAAVEMAKAFGATVHLVHVCEIPTYIGSGALAGEVPLGYNYGAIHDRVMENAREKMAALEKGVAAKGVSVNPVIKEGTAFIEIVAAADELKADLVVMGTHGYTGLQHLLIGSVAERVVRTAKCPVMTIKPQAKE